MGLTRTSFVKECEIFHLGMYVVFRRTKNFVRFVAACYRASYSLLGSRSRDKCGEMEFVGSR